MVLDAFGRGEKTSPETEKHPVSEREEELRKTYGKHSDVLGVGGSDCNFSGPIPGFEETTSDFKPLPPRHV
jgi:hypothetical protein